MVLVGMFLNFGAMFIPVLYMLAMRFKGSAQRLMLIGFGLQLFWSAGVAALVWFSWRAGNKDYWAGWGLLLPVNILSLIYYSTVLFLDARKAKQGTSGGGNSQP
jgi:hypothetical protein